MLLYQTLAFAINQKTWKSHRKIIISTWNEEFELSDGSYSVSDIQDYFEYIIKKHDAITDNLWQQWYT